MTASTTRVQRYSLFISYIAHILLIINLVAERSARVSQVGGTFFAGAFVALMIGTFAVVGVFWWLAASRRLLTILEKSPVLALIWTVASFTAIVIAPVITSTLRPYTGSYMFWLLMLNPVLLLIAFTPFLSRFNLGTVAKNLTIMILGVLIPLLILEMGMRVWFIAFGTEQDRIAYVYSVEQIVEIESPLTGLPYINYGLSTDYAGHNSRGYRGAEFTSPKPEGTFRIVAIGGSTTYGDNIPAQFAYPAQLERVLREEHGYANVEVLNAGVIQYNSYDSVANVIYHVLDDEPDMIIIYHAINDIIARLVDPAHYNGLNPMRGLWSLEGRTLPASTLARFIAINLGIIDNPNNISWAFNNIADVIRCTDTEFCPQLDMTPMQLLETNPPTYFERNLRTIIAVAQANDIQVMLSSWAYYPNEVNGNPYMTNEFIQFGVMQHNTITATLATELNLPYYDLYASMPENKDFWLDGMHMTPDGTYEQASQYAAFLIESGLLPQSAD